MASPFVRRRRLATELRMLREAKGMTADQLAKRINQSRMKISRLENAHGRPDLADLMKILDILEVTGDKWQEVIRIARDAAEKGWWDSFGDAMGARQRLYADIESGAKTIREYNQTAIPGILQTPEFTWALVELDRAEGPLDYSPERMAEARLQRQRAILRPGGPTIEIVLDEFVIRRLAVPPAIMREQLRHLIRVASGQPRVAVHVLPFDARLMGGSLPRSSFHLFEFADREDPPMAVVDTVSTDLVHSTPQEVARYRGHYERLHAAALSAAESVTYLERTTQHLSDQAGISR
jgi:transcriptional regulator with XRE-family HTH domain